MNYKTRLTVPKLAECVIEEIEEMPEGSIISLIEIVEGLLGVEGLGWKYDKQHYCRTIVNPANGNHLLREDELFPTMNAVLFLAAQRGILLEGDFFGETGIPFNLPFRIWLDHDELDTPNNFFVCILHHPLQVYSDEELECPGNYPIDKAKVFWVGESSNEKKALLGVNEDGPYELTYTVQPIDRYGSYAIAVYIDEDAPYEVGLVREREPYTFEEPLCDAEEKWTIIAARKPFNVDEVMKAHGYRKEGDTYISWRDEEARDDYYSCLN